MKKKIKSRIKKYNLWVKTKYYTNWRKDCVLYITDPLWYLQSAYERFGTKVEKIEKRNKGKTTIIRINIFEKIIYNYKFVIQDN